MSSNNALICNAQMKHHKQRALPLLGETANIHSGAEGSFFCKLMYSFIQTTKFRWVLTKYQTLQKRSSHFRLKEKKESKQNTRG